MKSIFVVIAFLGVFSLQAQSDELRQQHFNLKKHSLAIQGYDPVSYFNESGPLEGSQKFQAEYKGVLYRFATEDNLELFKETPAQYEPAWGGWCGYAMATSGKKVKINPKSYKIVNGQNILFYKVNKTDTLDSWNKELESTSEDQLVARANDSWGVIIE